MGEELLEEQRENWGTRAGFVLAAIGSAVGLGNLWGFPYKVYSFGGGAFLIPYLLAMLLVGIPLLIAEFSLGHVTQRATPDAFGRANRKFAFVGWWQIILSFIIVTYYAVILAYCLSFVGYSVLGIFQGELPWAGEGVEGVRNARAFFYDDYLAKHDGFALGGFRAHIMGALAITWLGMYLCIFRGVKLVGKVVLWTVPLPWLMLLILTLRGLTLEGAVQGLEYYLEPSWDRLANPVTWRWGFGQMFFSMSLAFGIMITYASFLHRKSDLNNNATIIGLADVATSFTAGLAVFATLGGMAYATQMAGAGVPVEDVTETGPSLAFVAFPYALAQLPHAAWFSLLFFGSLLLLGIDSAFSITESVLASVVDKTGWSRGKALVGITGVGFVIGLVFCTQGGLNWLSTFDEFINGTWGITLTALLECFVLGWLFRLSRLRRHANERSDWRIGRWWEWCVRLVIPAFLAALFAWSLYDGLENPGGYVRKYKPDPVSVTVPATDELPERPILNVAFVADYSGKTEHVFTLDPSKPAETHEGWSAKAGGECAPLGETFTADDVTGRKLTFTTDAVTPRTAYTIRSRWTSRPRRDPKTGLPVPVPPEEQAEWTTLRSVTTTSRDAGLHPGNFAGLCLMIAAPVLAIVIAAVRVRPKLPPPIHTPYTDSRPRGRGIGVAGTAVGLGSVGLFVAVVPAMLSASRTLRAATDVEAAAGTVGTGTMVGMLTGAGLLALGALLIGGPLVLRLEARQIRASMTARLSAGLGVLGIGLTAGLALALTMMRAHFPETKIEYDNELSGTSYLILGAFVALVVVGLGWCFYRALKAAGGGEVEEQYPEET